MSFILDNIMWIIGAVIILIMTVVGYFAEKTDFGRTKDVKKESKDTQKIIKDIAEDIENNDVIANITNSESSMNSIPLTVNNENPIIDKKNDIDKSNSNNENIETVNPVDNVEVDNNIINNLVDNVDNDIRKEEIDLNLNDIKSNNDNNELENNLNDDINLKIINNSEENINSDLINKDNDSDLIKNNPVDNVEVDNNITNNPVDNIDNDIRKEETDLNLNKDINNLVDNAEENTNTINKKLEMNEADNTTNKNKFNFFSRKKATEDKVNTIVNKEQDNQIVEEINEKDIIKLEDQKHNENELDDTWKF